jgi:hypothetical protein
MLNLSNKETVDSTLALMAREYTTIVLHIAADKAKEFEQFFEREELKRWDDYTRRGRFVEARLIRCRYSALQSEGIQDYVLHVVTADERAHHEHDEDPGFKSYDERAEVFQPEEPTVTFGDLVFERQAGAT